MYLPKYASLHYSLLMVVMFFVGTECSGNNDSKSPIYISGFFSLGGRWVSKHILPSVDLALEHINENPTVLPDYKLKMIWEDTQCDSNKATQALYHQLYNPPVKLAIIGDGCSISTRAIAANAGFWNLTTVSYAAATPSLSNREEFPYFFRTIIPDSMLNPVRISLMRRFGWNRVATLHGIQDVFSSAVNDFENLLQEENITLITSQSVTPNHIDQVINTLKDEDAKIITLNMYASRARQVFCEAYNKEILGHGKGRSKGYVWILLGWYRERWWEGTNHGEEQFNCTEEQMKEAVESSFYISTEMQQLDSSGRVTKANITADEYVIQLEEYINQTKYKGYMSDEDGPLGYDAAWAIALMLDNVSRSLDINLTTFSYKDSELTEEFFKVLSKTRFAGVSGEVQFDSNGDRRGKIQVRQFQPECNEGWNLVDHTCVKNISESACEKIPGAEVCECPDDFQVMSELQDNKASCCELKAEFKERLVAHYEDTSDEKWNLIRNFTWPGGQEPTDKTPPVNISERVHEITLEYFAPMFAISTLGILLCVFLFVFNTIYRNRRFIKLSSPGMNNLIILGALLTYFIVFPLSLENADKSPKTQAMGCQAFVWLSSVGFVLGFGAMVTKTWRVYKIAVFKVPKRVVIVNNQLYLMVGVMVAIDAVILAILSSHLEVVPVIREIKPDPSINNRKTIRFYEECDFEHMDIFFTILWGYHSILAIFGIFLAWQTRKVTIDGLNDSKIIGICIYKLGLVFAIYILFIAFGSSNPAVSFVVRSSIFLYYVTFTLIVIFVPKIKSVYFNDDTAPPSEHHSSNTDTPCGDTIDEVKDRLNKAQSEIQRLKEIIQKGGQGNDPPSGCGMWCYGAMCGCCASPKLWKVSTANPT